MPIDNDTVDEQLGSIYIIVLNWNQWALTADCIQSLLQVESPHLHTFQIVVVDNASRDGSIEKLEGLFPNQITLLRNAANLGFSGGNNVGIKYALKQSADYIMLLNNDTKVGADFLKPLLERLCKQTNIGVSTPKIYFMHRSRVIWAVGGEIIRWSGKGRARGQNEVDVGQHDQAQPVDFAAGCCFLAKRAVFEQVGMLDEAYFAYFEDVDWSQRVWKCGWEVWYEPESDVWHVAGASISSTDPKSQGHRTPFLIYLLARNNLWFIQSHLSGLWRLTALLAFFARDVFYYSAAYLLLFRFQKLKSLWRGVYDGTRKHSISMNQTT